MPKRRNIKNKKNDVRNSIKLLIALVFMSAFFFIVFSVMADNREAVSRKVPIYITSGIVRLIEGGCYQGKVLITVADTGYNFDSTKNCNSFSYVSSQKVRTIDIEFPGRIAPYHFALTDWSDDLGSHELRYGFHPLNVTGNTQIMHWMTAEVRWD